MKDFCGTNWVARLDEYCEKFARFEKCVERATTNEMSMDEKLELIETCSQAFWASGHVVREFFIWQGDVGLEWALDAFQLAFRRGLLTQQGSCLVEACETLRSKALTNNPAAVDNLSASIVGKYYDSLKEVKTVFLGQKRVHSKLEGVEL